MARFGAIPAEGLRRVFDRDPMALLERLPITSVQPVIGIFIVNDRYWSLIDQTRGVFALRIAQKHLEFSEV